MDDLEEMLSEPNQEEWTVTTDSAADWAVEKIKENNSEAQRLAKLCDEKIAFYQEKKAKALDKAESDNYFLKAKLFDYFRMVKPKELKSQFKYDLVSGSLVMPKAKVEYKRDDETIIKYLKDAGYTDFVKVIPQTESLAWGELKKHLIYNEGSECVALDTGEVIDGIKAEMIPGEFTIK